MFQSRCRDSWGCDQDLISIEADPNLVSVPLPGFMGLRLDGFTRQDKEGNGFSPVAGIHGVATSLAHPEIWEMLSFSPVAGIHGVATCNFPPGRSPKAGFSPVAGIHGVATRTTTRSVVPNFY